MRKKETIMSIKSAFGFGSFLVLILSVGTAVDSFALTMTIYNTTGNSTDAMGVTILKLNSTLDDEAAIMTAINKSGINATDLTLGNKTGIPTN